VEPTLQDSALAYDCRHLVSTRLEYRDYGVLLAIFFTAAGDASASGQDLAGSLKAGMQRIQEVGGASLGDRTMIDALSPALDALAQDLDGNLCVGRQTEGA